MMLSVGRRGFGMKKKEYNNVIKNKKFELKNWKRARLAHSSLVRVRRLLLSY